MKFTFLNILISLVVVINCKVGIKSSDSFPHRVDKDYVIIFEKLDTKSIFKLSIIDRYKEVEQIEIKFTKSAFNSTNYLEKVNLNYETKTMKIKFKKECNMKKLIIYDMLLGKRLYRKVIDLIELGTLKFDKEDVIWNGTRYIKFTCASKHETHFSIPNITKDKNLAIISQKYGRNPNNVYVLLLIKPEDNGKVLTCSDEVGSVKKLIIHYDGHPNEVKIIPNFETIRINETLQCIPYPTKVKTKLFFKWTIKIWNNETFNYSNKSLNLFELNKLSKCDYLSVSCEIKSSYLNTTKFLSKTIQFIKTNSNEENVRKNIYLTKKMCIMENRIWKFEKETKKLKESISSLQIELKRSNQKISSLQIDLKRSNQKISSLQIDLKRSNQNISLINKELIKLKNEIRQSPISFFVWRVDNIIQKREDAKLDKSKEILRSDPFFTKQSGYKLRLSMNPNGFNTGLNTHLSLFLEIMRSGHDEILAWPCTETVKFSLIDTRSKTPYASDTFSFKQDGEKFRECFIQPTKEFNESLGLDKFVSWTDLLDDTKNLIKDGSIYIKVDLEQ